VKRGVSSYASDVGEADQSGRPLDCLVLHLHPPEKAVDGDFMSRVEMPNGEPNN
jgi:hypothetical protein